MKRAAVLLSVLLFLLSSALHAQEKRLRITRKALDIGVYDYGKVKKKSPYKVYFDERADEKFTEVLMKSERLINSGLFGQYVTYENDSTAFVRESVACEYCPELSYVMETGGHGFLFAYDLETLEEIFVNPSTFVYSPSGSYRFGTFHEDGMNAYLEVKQGDKWISHLISVGPIIEGVYWLDDQTIHYLEEKERPSGGRYWIGYSMKFYFENKPDESDRIQSL